MGRLKKERGQGLGRRRRGVLPRRRTTKGTGKMRVWLRMRDLETTSPMCRVK